MDILLQGALLQASLIFALGAQNLFVLNTGLKKQGINLVVLTSALCDFLLVMLGVLGAGLFFDRFPKLRLVLGVLGIAFLFWYGFKKFRSSANSSEINRSQSPKTHSLFIQAIGYSLLNPHAILDTVVLIGGYSSRYLLLRERIFFGLGASFASLIWFFFLGYFARAFSNLFESERSFRRLDYFTGTMLIVFGLFLSKEVYKNFFNS